LSFGKRIKVSDGGKKTKSSPSGSEEKRENGGIRRGLVTPRLITGWNVGTATPRNKNEKILWACFGRQRWGKKSEGH